MCSLTVTFLFMGYQITNFVNSNPYEHDDGAAHMPLLHSVPSFSFLLIPDSFLHSVMAQILGMVIAHSVNAMHIMG